MGLLQKLEEAVTDFATLEVATFTKAEPTNIPVSMSFSNDQGNVSSDTVFTAVRAALANEELVGYARFEIDGDTVAFVNNNPAYSDVLEYHKSVIQDSQNARKAIYDTIVGLGS
ncbi:hypothetical protein [Roseivirga misakiensis]|uniref:Uncharacterized protein n=1 Tax=Roseivirga misakiensis TaxID=1563681 RepID=A0A1E5SZY2_9BACT|nr:hypothetical protein [Roseivirga misakiensis]OEK04683.1 hypothetical protein BFP71_14615 [Roseivirga misakiensis]